MYEVIKNFYYVSRTYKKGEQVEFKERNANHLLKIGVIKVVEEAPKKKAEKKKTKEKKFIDESDLSTNEG